MLFGGELQIDAKKSNFGIFERTYNIKSRSMPLTLTLVFFNLFLQMAKNMMFTSLTITNYVMIGYLPLVY